MSAALMGHMEVCKLMVEYEADPNLADEVTEIIPSDTTHLPTHSPTTHPLTHPTSLLLSTQKNSIHEVMIIITRVSIAAVAAPAANAYANDVHAVFCFAWLLFISTLLNSPCSSSFPCYMQEGNTALHWACREKKLEVAKWLVEQMSSEAVVKLNQVIGRLSVWAPADRI